VEKAIVLATPVSIIDIGMKILYLTIKIASLSNPAIRGQKS
jgi:hypothetical protein